MKRFRAISAKTLLALIVLGFVIALTRPREHRLLDRATPLMAASSWLKTATYFWLTPDSILTIANWPQRVEVGTGKSRDLPGFAPSYTAAIGMPLKEDGSFHSVEYCYLSPDARWLICPETGDGKWTAYSLDGKRSIAWTGMPNLQTPLWMNDHEFVVLPNGNNDMAYRCNLIRGGPSSHIKLGRSINAASHVGVLPSGSVRFAQYVEALNPTLDYTDITLSPEPSFSSGTFRLPCPAIVNDLQFSPDRTRIAWGMECNRHLHGPYWYTKVLQWIGMPDRETWELWISDYQGNHWRQLGFLENPDSDPMPYALEWTPDGKQISFLVAKTLYIVDAD